MISSLPYDLGQGSLVCLQFLGRFSFVEPNTSGMLEDEPPKNVYPLIV